MNFSKKNHELRKSNKIDISKTLVMIFSIIGLITFSSCTQKADVSSLLDNSETRSEIFTAIAGNHNMMMSFMETMQDNDHAMQMMQGNKMMMGKMMKGGGMGMMMKDSMMMHSMMGNMMKNSQMMVNMMQMMNNEVMMSNECMQAMMKMMSDKGMDMMN